MNKKLIAIILSLILVFSAVLLISGCNKDDENTNIPNESTDSISETEQNSEDASDEKTEGTTDEKESEKLPENSTKPVENQSETSANQSEITTENSTKPIEKPTDKDEPVTCDVCGNVVLNDENSSNMTIGNYCDGNCDGWFDA